MGKDWSITENQLVINDYFNMLEKELRGFPFVKKRHNENLSVLLPNRTKGSIEFKHQNISGILVRHNTPYIQGYKPLLNTQNLLEEMVIAYLEENQNFDLYFESFSKENPGLPHLNSFSFERVESDPPSLSIFSEGVSKPIQQRLRKINYFQKEQRNRDLGRAGEEFAMEFEKWRLIRRGKEKYLDKLEWISDKYGDGAGYDILSRNDNGTDRNIEVKTTKLTEITPYFFTQNELMFSRENPANYCLYRVYNFASSPKIFIKEGSLDRSCSQFKPTHYKAFP